MPAKARNRLPAKALPGARTRHERVEDRLAGARRLADHRIGGVALAHLRARRRHSAAGRPAAPASDRRDDVAIAEAAARIDHHQRIVDVDARALEAVVHDQEIAAAVRSAGARRPRDCGVTATGACSRPAAAARRRHAWRCRDAASTMMRLGKAAAMAARQEAGLQLHALGLPGERDRDRGLAGAADGEIADAQHRRVDLLAPGLASCAGRRRAP